MQLHQDEVGITCLIARLWWPIGCLHSEEKKTSSISY